MELYDINNLENRSIKTTSTLLGKEIFSYEYSFFELNTGSEKKYLLIYTFSSGNDKGYKIELSIISFPDSDLSNCVIENKAEIDNYYNRVVSGFIMGSLIIIFHLNRELKYSIIVYDLNITHKKTMTGIWDITSTSNYNKGDGLFFKCILLKENIGVFIFYTGLYDYYPVLKIGSIDESSYTFTLLFEKTISNYEFNNNVILLNDLLKINDNRFSFVTVSKDSTTLYVFLFDIYNNNQNMKIRIFKPNLTNYKFVKELSIIIYNNYLAFTSSVVIPGSYTSEGTDCFSIFMIFGYANGTDTIFDISLYFTDDNENNEYNLINDLTQNIVINNNIFGYEVVQEINLVSIPEQIFFYKENVLLSDNQTLNMNYKFKQNKDLLKTNEYYSLVYQFIMQEPNYETFNGLSDAIIDCSKTGTSSSFTDQDGFYNQNIFYGRANTLQFKLCHNYCGTCKEIGKDINDQKCESCLPDYQYDYPEISLPNCVPEGYYKDLEKGIIPFSEGNPKFFTNITSNKTIYFDNSLDCPDEYPFLMTNNECKDSCLYEDLLNQLCSIQKSNDLIYEELKELIQSYPTNGESLVVEGEDEYVFQVTTTVNELGSLDGVYINGHNLSMIDLAECHKKIIENYDDIDEDTPLIFLKFEKSTSTASEKNIQYEVYHPYSKELINLTICEDTNVDVYIPITLSEGTENKYIKLKESGYDLFNLNDSFYNDICTPFQSEDGTDILLSDRKNYFYNNNDTTCQSNCQFAEYSFDTKYLKCECNVQKEEIDVVKTEKFAGKTIFTSFYSVLKYSNYKVLKCIYLVFSSKGITKNYGCIIVIILFLLYIPFFILYVIKGIDPIKIDAINTYYKKEENNAINNKNNNSNSNNKMICYIKKNNLSKYNPNRNSKKIKKKKERNSTDIDIFKFNNKLNTKESNKNIKKMNFPLKRKVIVNSKKKNKKPGIILTTVFHKKLRDSLTKGQDKFDKSDKIIFNKKLETSSKRNILIDYKKKVFNSKFKGSQISPILAKKKKVKKITEQLDDFELNELSYLEAIELDKRPFHKTYWTILKREHLILFTFFSWNDYNLSYIKFARFFFLLCTDMAMNVFFFSDDSMHKLYLNYGKYDFIQQIPQTVYSTIVSQVLEIFLCFLSLTDKHIYQIKELRTKKNSQVAVVNIIRCINIKLIGFFIFTFVLFLFYWYIITAFCSVYKNTQIPFIKDALTSFATSLISPFVVYIIPAGLRIISLKDVEKKRLKFVYKLSDIIPFF